MSGGVSNIRRIKDLDRLQQWMGEAIRAPESKLRQTEREAAFYLAGDGRQSAADRLHIYVRDYWARCLDSLRQDFRGVEFILGARNFRAWMEAYLVRHPSHSYTLRNLGIHLLAFMKKMYRGPRRDMILDMIRFEWAKIDAFDRSVMPPFDPGRLTGAQKRRLDRMPFRLQPHVTLLELNYPVYEIVDKLVTRKRAALPSRKKCFTVVYRREGRVYHKEIDRIFYSILADLRDGHTLFHACTAVQRRLRANVLNHVQSDVQTWFQNAVANQWFCGPKGVPFHERLRPTVSVRNEFSLQNRLVAPASRPGRHRVRVLRSR